MIWRLLKLYSDDLQHGFLSVSGEDVVFLVLAQDNKVVKQNTKLLPATDPDTVLTLNSSGTTVNGRCLQTIANHHHYRLYRKKKIVLND